MGRADAVVVLLLLAEAPRLLLLGEDRHPLPQGADKRLRRLGADKHCLLLGVDRLHLQLGGDRRLLPLAEVKPPLRAEAGPRQAEVPLQVPGEGKRGRHQEGLTLDGWGPMPELVS